MPALLVLLAFAPRPCAGDEDPGAGEVTSAAAAAPVDFARDLLPVLRRNCLACHNESRARGDVVLETVADIRAGTGDGPLVVAGSAERSRLFRVAERSAEPFMPPENRVGAVALAAGELALLRRWIEEGARESGASDAAEVVEWSRLPPALRPIYAVDVTDNGRLAVCGRGNRVFVYELPTAEALAELVDPALGAAAAAHRDLVHSLASTRDGRTIATGGYRTVKLWRQVEPEPQPAAGAHDRLAPPAALCALDRSGRSVAFLWGSGRVEIRDSSDGRAPRVAQRLALAEPPTALALDGRNRLLVGAGSGVVRAFELAASAAAPPTRTLEFCGGPAEEPAPIAPPPIAPAREFRVDATAVTAIAAIDGTVEAPAGGFVAAGESGVVSFFGLDGAAPVRRIETGARVDGVAVSAVGDLLAVAAGGEAWLLDAATGERRRELRGDPALDPVATRRRWDLEVARERAGRAREHVEALEKTRAERANALDAATEALARAAAALAEKDSATDAEASEREKAKAARDTATAALESAREALDAAQAELGAAREALAARARAVTAAEGAARRHAGEAARRESRMSAVALSADGRRAAGAGERGRIVTWSTATGEPLAAIEHGAAVAALGFSDGGELVTAGQRGDVRRRPLAPRWEVAAVLGGPAESTFTDRVTALAFDAGGTRLAVGGGDPSRRGEVKIFALDGLTPVLDLPELHSDTVFALAFSADGRRLASAGGDKLVRVIDVASGAPVATFAGHTHHVLDVSWHYGGELLASAGADQVVKVWDLASGAQRRTLDGFDKQVSGVSFVAATTRIVTGSGDAKVRLLDAADGASVRSFEGFRDYVYALAQDLDGDLVVAGGFDGVLRVWATETGELRAAFAPP